MFQREEAERRELAIKMRGCGQGTGFEPVVKFLDNVDGNKK